ncbi:diaminopimelate epimerase [Terriglobus aquaticus]|uniref:Diaminopimelate epimerase n=1 Tax=Terriglobus aquaticus TaxID=940139 RepID=A0ABW9KJ74_9BACT|nr:diaminopimelate epimerase [Terriglobus aquaticus]
MIPFVKAHACGNDFLILEESVANGQHAALARELCSRHYGIGADGIEFVDRRADGSFFLRLFNADGSEAELSGNGTRCVAAWIAYSEGLKSTTIETHGGVRTCNVVECDDADFLIETDMGVPTIQERTVDLHGIGPVQGAVVNVGNPHFVLFTVDQDFRTYGHTWEALGAYLCTHRDFPGQTNVEFVRIISPTEIQFRIYERGVGPTHSSGTGTCAAATAAITLRNCARLLTASSIGGPQRIHWPASDQPMRLTGPARIVCTGNAVSALRGVSA